MPNYVVGATTELPEPEQDTLVFTRVDPLPRGKYARPYADSDIDTRAPYDDDDNTGSAVFTRSSMLILVLVMVPLGIGGAAVVIVSCNYYCHLC